MIAVNMKCGCMGHATVYPTVIQIRVSDSDPDCDNHGPHWAFVPYPNGKRRGWVLESEVRKKKA